MKRILFIVNGAKKQSKKLQRILTFFSNHTFFSKVEVVTTHYSGHATIIANEKSTTCDYIIAVGGDGTCVGEQRRPQPGQVHQGITAIHIRRNTTNTVDGQIARDTDVNIRYEINFYPA